MEKPTRRNLLKAAAVGGVTATGLGAVFGAQRGLAANAPDQKRGRGGDDDEHDHGHDDDNEPLSGKRALAVVSFGQWEVEDEGPAPGRGPVDRMGAVPNNRNVHKLLPFEVDIEQGGAVSFIISGFHQVLIYAGKTLEDVQAGWIAAGRPTIAPIPPGLVDYAPDRVFRGLSPAPPQTADRVESVNFLLPGRYLVVCGVVPHFNEGMHGFVNVREAD